MSLFSPQKCAEQRIADQDKPSFWLLHCLGWLFYVVSLTIDNVAFIGSDKLANNLVVFLLLISGMVAFLLTLPLRFLYRRLWGLSPVSLCITVALSSFLVAAIWTPMKNMVIWSWEDNYSIWLVLQGQFDAEHQPARLFMTISYAFFMVMVWSSLYFGINYHFRLVKEKEQHFRAVMLSHNAQIKMLRYQINPHFLFNTLNAISTLVLQGSKQRANAMLIQLATFFRYSLDNDPEKKITLQEELEALRLYLEIEKTRFDERVTVYFDVSQAAEKLLVPSLIIQPLVENSIKYAIAKMKSGGEIRITAYCTEQKLILQVADNGPFTSFSQLPAISQGVGLQNIDERLKVIYPYQHQFELSVAHPQGFVVTMQLPMEPVV